MRILNTFILAIVGITLAVSSCKEKDPVIPEVPGCMDSLALNYNASATLNDGSCEYPKTFIPLSVGNTWTLSDEINIFIPVTVVATFEVTKDTLIDGTEYALMPENYEAGGFGSFNDLKYAYRTAINGDVYRRYVSTDSLGPESKFLDYPLEIGNTWVDNETEPSVDCEVMSQGTVTVPAGTFADTWAIRYTRREDGISSTFYFAEDTGIIRVATDLDFQGQQFTLDFELDSYTVN